MPYTPLTENQFNKAINAGYSPQDITAFELQRKQEIETLEKPKKTLGQKAMGVAQGVTNFIGAKGIADQFGADTARARVPQEQKGFVQYPSQKEVLGSAVQTGSLLIPGSLGAKAASKIGGTGLAAGSARLGAKIGAGAATGYGLDVGAGLQAGEENPYKPGPGTAIGGAIPVAGGLFNLGKSAVKKAAPNVLEFTSGVPREAVRTAMERPAAAKLGRTDTNLEEIRNQSAQELKKLYTQLSQEFDTGLDDIVKTSKQGKDGAITEGEQVIGNSDATRKQLFEYTKRFGREFRLGFKKSADGTTVDFSKSPIIKGGEQGNVQEAINTIAGWKDFSARGMQDLAERVGALRKFESGAKTESSAILGKVYHKLTRDLIGKNYPELAALRTDYGKNRKTLDAINDVLKIDKTNPVAVQGSINRLKQVFQEDKETYLKLIKELSDRSGVDILGQLAGEQFQKYLPNFVRGLGGGAVVSVGASVVNPWLILLAPLFSPRTVGKVVEKASVGSPAFRATASVAKKVAPLVGASTGTSRQEP